ncbi:2540_t:CDS:1, partial [Gigaspora rosea]
MFDDISLPSVEMVDQKWKKADVINFLQENQDKLDLEDDDIDIIKKNRVSGPAFLSLTLETLTQKDGSFVLSYGPAKVIADLINKIKGEDQ